MEPFSDLHVLSVKYLALDAKRLSRLDSFLENFASLFHRADQFLRFKSYVLGILSTTERKNVESIASAMLEHAPDNRYNAQSLQHFVSNSPWNHNTLRRELYKCSKKDRFDPKAIIFVHDGIFAKKGRHSIGVQRQYARSLGQKINCQVGVFVTQFGPSGFFPLAAQLYLPSTWMRDNAAKVAQQIPEENRAPNTKAEIALDLLNELVELGEPKLPVFAEAGYISDEKFLSNLIASGFTIAENSESLLRTVTEKFAWLKSDFGLDHFEGRTWHGWHHHVMLIFVAYHFLAKECRFYN